jgi:hypothetical protein
MRVGVCVVAVLLLGLFPRLAIGCDYRVDEPLMPPPLVLAHLDAMHAVDRLGDLPPPVRQGTFEGGFAADESKPLWMADRTSVYQSTDVSFGNFPLRRLIAAGCDDTLCLVHYVRGGGGWSLDIVAIAKVSPTRWRMQWHAVSGCDDDWLDWLSLVAVLQGRILSSYSDAARFHGIL